MNAGFARIDQRMDRLTAIVFELVKDVAELKTDVTQLKAGVGELRGGVGRASQVAALSTAD